MATPDQKPSDAQEEERESKSHKLTSHYLLGIRRKHVSLSFDYTELRFPSGSSFFLCHRNNPIQQVRMDIVVLL